MASNATPAQSNEATRGWRDEYKGGPRELARLDALMSKLARMANRPTPERPAPKG